MTSDVAMHGNFMHDFLVTYSSFMSREDLMASLIDRFENVGDEDKTVVRARVVHVFQKVCCTRLRFPFFVSFPVPKHFLCG